jgi:hypothetical protein
MKKPKQIVFSGGFPECLAEALGKEFFLKKRNQFILRVSYERHSGEEVF